MDAMDVLTAQQMRDADRHTIEEAGVPARVLMENAGRAVADIVAESGTGGRRILILCGRGGNGGDGLVALRALAARGLRGTAVLLADPERLTGETKANYETAMQLALHVVPCPDEATWEWALRQTGPDGLAAPRPGVIVDAILGTGSSGPLRGLAARVIADLDHVGRFRDAVRIAVDIPTGLSADTGTAPDLCFRADLTVALAAPKICHFVYPASAACGEIRVAEIGIPRVWLNAGTAGVRTNDERRVAPFFPARAPGVHKGQLGRLLLVAGSRRMPGAAALAAQGALSAGVGLLTVAGPADGLTELPPEAMRLPLPASGEGEMSLDGVPEIARFAGDAIALGPGLGSGEETKEAVRRIVLTTSLPLVLDADGLNAWAERASRLAQRPGLALTPHPGEAARLLGLTSAEVQEDRLRGGPAPRPGNRSRGGPQGTGDAHRRPPRRRVREPFRRARTRRGRLRGRPHGSGGSAAGPPPGPAGGALSERVPARTRRGGSPQEQRGRRGHRIRRGRPPRAGRCTGCAGRCLR